MKSPSLLRKVLLISIIELFVLAASGWDRNTSHAGIPDKSGNDAVIESIAVIPDTVAAGSYPDISGIVHNTSSVQNGDNGTAIYDIIATIISPNGSKRNLIWHNVSFKADQRKLYKLGKDFDIKLPGTYKVAYSVYNSGRSHLFATHSRSFTLSSSTATTQTSPVSANTPSSDAAFKKLLPDKEPSLLIDRPGKISREGENPVFGIGGSVDTINFSAGPTLIVWPLKDVAVQGTYGFGTFTSYEARIFYRLPLSQQFNPYFGAGYIHSERKTTVIGVDTKISGSSFTAFGGIEHALSKNLRAYIDVSGTPMKLHKDITTATQQASATVTYSPITINIGLMMYLF